MKERRIPFPQANDMGKVVKICKKARKGSIRLSDVVEEFRFTERQAYLYINASMYLGLLRKDCTGVEPVYEITTEGLHVGNNTRVSSGILMLSMMEHPVLKRSLAYYYLLGHIPSKKIIIEFIKDSKEDKHLNSTTLSRRASTIYAWLNWAKINCPDINMELKKSNVLVLGLDVGHV